MASCPRKREPIPSGRQHRRSQDPNPTPLPQADWWVNSLSVGGLSLVFEVGGGFADGTIGFENLNKSRDDHRPHPHRRRLRRRERRRRRISPPECRT